jgi:hypothetical protein
VLEFFDRCHFPFPRFGAWRTAFLGAADATTDLRRRTPDGSQEFPRARGNSPIALKSHIIEGEIMFLATMAAGWPVAEWLLGLDW